MPFSHLWPWIGLGLAALLLTALAFGDLRGDRATPRTRDLAWLVWAATAAYLLHQFEEHGVDARGAAYAFRGELCGLVGYPDAAGCPVPKAFITAVNLPLVWLAGPGAALLARRWPALAVGYLGVPAVNAFVHLGPALAGGGYNPGLLTAVLLFLPLSFHVFRLALARPDLGWRVVVAAVAGGAAAHAVLMLSLKAHLAGEVGLAGLLAIQVINPALPLLTAFAAASCPPRAA
mgnify:CR=1 FL=1